MSVLSQAVDMGFKFGLLAMGLCVLYWLASFSTPDKKPKVESAKEVEPVTPSEPRIITVPAPRATPEELTVSLKVRELVQVLLNDPSVREEVYTAVRLGPIHAKSHMGYADSDGEFYSLYVDTNASKESLDVGFIHRSRDGERVQARFKKQNRESKEVVETGPRVLREKPSQTDLVALARAARDKVLSPTVIRGHSQDEYDVYEEHIDTGNT